MWARGHVKVERKEFRDSDGGDEKEVTPQRVIGTASE